MQLTYEKRLGLLCVEAARNTYYAKENVHLLDSIELHILSGIDYTYNFSLINNEFYNVLKAIRPPFTIETTGVILNALLTFSYKKEKIKKYKKSTQSIWEASRKEAKGHQDKLTQDIFPPYHDESLFINSNPTIRSIVDSIKKINDFSIFPILGDALEDAGCADELILDHCRQVKFHCKYCWVLYELE